MVQEKCFTNHHGLNIVLIVRLLLRTWRVWDGLKWHDVVF